MFSAADLLEMHRRMLVIRGFEERVAALYRDGEVPGFVHLSIGQEASAVGACWPLAPDRRDHVDPSRPRPLPRQGSRPARDVRRADGQGRGHEPRARRLDAHRRSDDRHLRRQRDRGGRPADRGGRRDRGAAAARRQRRGGVLRRRRGRARHLPRSGQPRRGVAAAGDLLLREQRLRRVLAGVDPARGAARAARRGLRRRLRRGRRQRRRGDRDRDARRWSTRSRAGRGPVVVEAATYRWHGHYEGDPQRYRSPDEVREWEARDPLLVNARRLRSAGVADDALESMQPTVARELDDAVEAARQLAAPGGRDADRLRRPPAARTPRAAGTGRRRPGVPHDGRDPRRARSGARGRRARVRRRDRRRRRRQRVRPDARPARPLRRSRPRHADLRERDRRPRRRRGDGGHATRSSS